MSLSGEPVPLRPLSLGEIFDRAVTLYVRNAGLFSLIALAVVIPMSVAGYLAQRQNSAALSQLLDQIQHPAKTAAASVPDPHLGMQLLLIAVGIVVTAFAFVGIAVAVGAIYRGERPTFADCYGYALRRAGAVLLVLLSQFAALIVTAFAGGIVLGIGVVADVLVVRGSAAAGVVVGVVLALVGVAWLFGILLCYLAFGLAFDAIAVERAPAGAAMGRGFARVFNRAELWRAFVLTLAIAVIYFGLAVVAVSIAGVLAAVHLSVLYILVNAAVSLVTTPFFGILLAVYYFDVRVRREGLDLQLQADRLQPAAQTP